MIHASEIQRAVDGYMNIKRIKAAGYGDTRVTGLTTVASLLADIATYRDSAAVHQSRRPIFDAAIESIQWLANYDEIDTTKVTALTSVATDSVTTDADLSYIFYSLSGFPTTTVPRTTDDMTIFSVVAT